MDTSYGDDPNYDNTHRTLLQLLQARPTLTFTDAQPILAALQSLHEDRAVLPQDIRPADVESYIHAINAAVAPFDYEIRGGVVQSYSQSSSSANAATINGDAAVPTIASQAERVYSLVNTTSDPLTALATPFKAEEIAYLKRLLDLIFETYNTPSREIMAVTSIQALEVSAPLTKSQAEGVLKRLVGEAWFVRFSGQGGHYTLSARALMELRDWLREAYNEEPEEVGGEGVERVKSCAACREIVTIGQRCERRSCKARLHEHCLASYFRMQGGRKKCGVCGEEWRGESFVGPKAARGRQSVGGRVRDAGEDEGDSEVLQTRPGQSNGVTNGSRETPVAI